MSRKAFVGFGLLAAALLFSGCSVKFSTSTRKPAPVAGIYHIVKSGETLWAIGRAYRVSVYELKRANGLKSDLIEIGQKVLVPGATKQRTVTATRRSTSTSTPTPSATPKAPVPPRPVVVARPASTAPGPGFAWPVKGRVVSAAAAVDREKRLAIETAPGEVVTASRAGTIFFAGETRNYRKTVIIDHQNGYFSVYGGDLSIECRKDQVVNSGSRIGRMADNQVRPLLYFEIRRGAEPVNPLPYLK